MKKQTMGIHHISAIVGNPQENVDFYAGVLGLRLVKRTVNFDDPETYHLYFGNEGGKPGTIITFFPWPEAFKGKIGDGQVGITSYAIPKGSAAFWKKRLAKFNIQFEETKRFGEQYLQFNDPHGLYLELVEREGGEVNTWNFGEVTPEVAIKGFGGATLLSARPNETGHLLQHIMGLKFLGIEGDMARYQSIGDIGNVIDVKLTPIDRGFMGVGTVHHIAFRAKDNEDHLDWQQYISNHGYHVTEVKDRNYFHAIYFRETGGILFEIATDPPGFAIDEPYELMGSNLMLPAQFESFRDKLESTLIQLDVKRLD